MLLTIKLALPLFFTGTIFAASVARWPAFDHMAAQDARIFLYELCEENRMTCVLDLTATNACSIVKRKNGGTVNEQFQSFVQQCPQYKLTKRGRIYVLEPKNKSDSPLMALVGPIEKKERVCFETMSELFSQSGLKEAPSRSGASTLGVGMAVMPPKTAKFSLERKSFKENLLEAARHYRPSIWVIIRTKDDAYDYDANSAISYIPPN